MTDSVKITVQIAGKALLTPEKKEMTVSSQALANAIAEEWKNVDPSSVIRHPSSATMPLTSLACTAIDRIEPQKDAIIEALMTYVDTDTLSYRSTGSKTLADRQSEQWDPIISWMSKKFGAIWQITTGIMALEQPAEMHDGIRRLLMQKSSAEIAAVSVMASVFSSLVLALAVLEKQLDAARAFALSRLEEESQAEAWGRDEEAEKRAAKMQAEILDAERFLRLLETVSKA